MTTLCIVHHIAETVDPVFTSIPTGVIIQFVNSAADLPVAVTWTVTATDNSGVAPTLSQTARPGDTFPLGDTVVTYTATDGAGNTATASFTVRVILGRFCSTIVCNDVRVVIFLSYTSHSKHIHILRVHARSSRSEFALREISLCIYFV